VIPIFEILMYCRTTDAGGKTTDAGCRSTDAGSRTAGTSRRQVPCADASEREMPYADEDEAADEAASDVKTRRNSSTEIS
jgi:hypothetical protein